LSFIPVATINPYAPRRNLWKKKESLFSSQFISGLSLGAFCQLINNQTNLECLITAAFGKPVVPEVKI
jgi:hypothetical protein